MYATQADLEQRFGTDEILRLSDRNHDQNIDTDVVQAALEDAQAMIDGMFASHPVPVQTHADLLKTLACDIARYRLYDNAITPTVQYRYEQAITQLQELVQNHPRVDVSEPRIPRVFTRTTLKEF